MRVCTSLNTEQYSPYELLQPCANALLKVLANRYAEVVETLKQLLAEVTGARAMPLL